MKKIFCKIFKTTIFSLIFFAGLGNTMVISATDVIDATGGTDVSVITDYVKAIERTNVFSLADDTSITLGTLESGQPAIILYTLENNWYGIYYKGQTGYVHVAQVTAFSGETGTIRKFSIENYQKQSPEIDALGDSIVYGDKLQHQGASFVNLLGKKINDARVNNYGWCGSALSGNNADRLLDRYLAMDNTADIIFVMGGTNDYGYGVELGSMGDKTDQTFYGGLNLLMCGLSQAYPESTLVFFTPLKRKGGDKPNSCGYLLSDYAKAVEEMGAFYGIQVVDLYDAAELDFTGRIRRYMPDGLHPNTRGHITMANYIYKILKND